MKRKKLTKFETDIDLATDLINEIMHEEDLSMSKLFSLPARDQSDETLEYVSDIWYAPRRDYGG